MHTEIGSEFWDYTSSENPVREVPEYFQWGCENRFLATGRTALDHIINDIKAIQKIEIVYMPSYCCHTMISPFISHGIKVIFYDVFVNKSGGLYFNIDYSIKCDAVVVMNYFGFITSETETIISNFKTKYHKIIIEDATHSVFCDKPFNFNSDYVYASLRKWFAIPGCALAAKLKSKFIIPSAEKVYSEYVAMRIKGMHLKKKYFETLSEKAAFLDVFHKTEELIEDDFKDYAADDISFNILKSIDIDNIRCSRVANTQLLIQSLYGSSKFRLLFDTLSLGDCPLFVPIIVNNSRRDQLKSYLIEKSIYCPVHWPISNFHRLRSSTKFIYDNQLSIICDQRYDIEDIERIIAAINKF